MPIAAAQASARPFMVERRRKIPPLTDTLVSLSASTLTADSEPARELRPHWRFAVAAATDLRTLADRPVKDERVEQESSSLFITLFTDVDNVRNSSPQSLKRN